MRHPELLGLPVLMIADYCLTLVGARLRERVYGQRFRLESYELNSFWQRDVAARRWWNPRVLALVVAFPALVLWWSERASVPPSTLRFVEAALLAVYCVVLARHLTALLEFRYLARHPDAVTGSVTLSQRFVLWQSVRQLLCVLGPGVIWGVPRTRPLPGSAGRLRPRRRAGSRLGRCALRSFLCAGQAGPGRRGRPRLPARPGARSRARTGTGVCRSRWCWRHGTWRALSPLSSGFAGYE